MLSGIGRAVWSIVAGSGVQDPLSHASKPMAKPTSQLLKQLAQNEPEEMEKQISGLSDEHLQNAYAKCDEATLRLSDDELQANLKRHKDTLLSIIKHTPEVRARMLLKIKACLLVLEKRRRGGRNFLKNSDSADQEPAAATDETNATHPGPMSQPDSAAAPPERNQKVLMLQLPPSKLSLPGSGSRSLAAEPNAKRGGKQGASSSKSGKKPTCKNCSRPFPGRNETRADGDLCDFCENEARNGTKCGAGVRVREQNTKARQGQGQQQQSEKQQRQRLQSSDSKDKSFAPRAGGRVPRQSKPPDVGATRDNAISLDDSDDDATEQQPALAAAKGEPSSVRRSTRNTRYISPAGQLEGLRALFQVDGSRHGVTVTSEDLSRLQPTEFLNDTLIEFYMRYLQMHPPRLDSPHTSSPDGAQPKDPLQFYFFSTFFYKKLVEELPGERLPRDQHERELAMYNRVKRWTKDVDIFSQNYIFIPIHSDVHWSLAIICQPGKITNCLRPDWVPDKSRKNSKTPGKKPSPSHETEPPPDPSSVLPAILHLDSLPGCHNTQVITKHLRAYLRCEWEHRAKQEAAPSPDQSIPWKFHHEHPEAELPVFDLKQCHQLVPKKIPQQDNGCDCGLFVLAYIEFFMVAAPACLTKDHHAMRQGWNPLFRTTAIHDTFLTCRWFDADNTSLLRAYIEYRIKKLLLQEYEGFLPKEAGNGVELAPDLAELLAKINHLREFIAQYESTPDEYGMKYIPAAWYDKLADGIKEKRGVKRVVGITKGAVNGKMKEEAAAEKLGNATADADDIFDRIVDETPEAGPSVSVPRNGEERGVLQEQHSVVDLDESEEVMCAPGTQDAEHGPEALPLAAEDEVLEAVQQGGVDAIGVGDGDGGVDDGPENMSEEGEREEDDWMFTAGADDGGLDENNNVMEGAAGPWHVRTETGAVSNQDVEGAARFDRLTDGTELAGVPGRVGVPDDSASSGWESDVQEVCNDDLVLSPPAGIRPDEYHQKVVALRQRPAPQATTAPAGETDNTGITPASTSGQPQQFPQALADFGSTALAKAKVPTGQDVSGVTRAAEQIPVDLTAIGSPETPSMNNDRSICWEDYDQHQDQPATEPAKKAKFGCHLLNRPHTSDTTSHKRQSKSKSTGGGKTAITAVQKPKQSRSYLNFVSLTVKSNAIAAGGGKTEDPHPNNANNHTATATPSQHSRNKRLKQTTFPGTGQQTTSSATPAAAAPPYTADQVDLVDSDCEDTHMQRTVAEGGGEQQARQDEDPYVFPYEDDSPVRAGVRAADDDHGNRGAVRAFGHDESGGRPIEQTADMQSEEDDGGNVRCKRRRIAARAAAGQAEAVHASEPQPHDRHDGVWDEPDVEVQCGKGFNDQQGSPEIGRRQGNMRTQGSHGPAAAVQEWTVRQEMAAPSSSEHGQICGNPAHPGHNNSKASTAPGASSGHAPQTNSLSNQGSSHNRVQHSALDWSAGRPAHAGNVAVSPTRKVRTAKSSTSNHFAHMRGTRLNGIPKGLGKSELKHHRNDQGGLSRNQSIAPHDASPSQAQPAGLKSPNQPGNQSSSRHQPAQQDTAAAVIDHQSSPEMDTPGQHKQAASNRSQCLHRSVSIQHQQQGTHNMQNASESTKGGLELRATGPFHQHGMARGQHHHQGVNNHHPHQHNAKHAPDQHGHQPGPTQQNYQFNHQHHPHQTHQQHQHSEVYRQQSQNLSQPASSQPSPSQPGFQHANVLVPIDDQIRVLQSQTESHLGPSNHKHSYNHNKSSQDHFQRYAMSDVTHEADAVVPHQEPNTILRMHQHADSADVVLDEGAVNDEPPPCPHTTHAAQTCNIAPSSSAPQAIQIGSMSPPQPALPSHIDPYTTCDTTSLDHQHHCHANHAVCPASTGADAARSSPGAAAGHPSLLGVAAVHPSSPGVAAVHPSSPGVAAVHPSSPGVGAVHPSSPGVAARHPESIEMQAPALYAHPAHDHHESQVHNPATRPWSPPPLQQPAHNSIHVQQNVLPPQPDVIELLEDEDDMSAVRQHTAQGAAQTCQQHVVPTTGGVRHTDTDVTMHDAHDVSAPCTSPSYPPHTSVPGSNGEFNPPNASHAGVASGHQAMEVDIGVVSEDDLLHDDSDCRQVSTPSDDDIDCDHHNTPHQMRYNAALPPTPADAAIAQAASTAMESEMMMQAFYDKNKGGEPFCRGAIPAGVPVVHYSKG